MSVDAPVAAQARTLFSAVHGLVLLGLDDKLADEGARHDGEAEMVAFVQVYLAGLRQERAIRSTASP